MTSRKLALSCAAVASALIVGASGYGWYVQHTETEAGRQYEDNLSRTYLNATQELNECAGQVIKGIHSSKAADPAIVELAIRGYHGAGENIDKVGAFASVIGVDPGTYGLTSNPDFQPTISSVQDCQRKLQAHQAPLDKDLATFDNWRKSHHHGVFFQSTNFPDRNLTLVDGGYITNATLALQIMHQPLVLQNVNAQNVKG